MENPAETVRQLTKLVMTHAYPEKSCPVFVDRKKLEKWVEETISELFEDDDIYVEEYDDGVEVDLSSVFAQPFTARGVDFDDNNRTVFLIFEKKLGDDTWKCVAEK